MVMVGAIVTHAMIDSSLTYGLGRSLKSFSNTYDGMRLCTKKRSTYGVHTEKQLDDSGVNSIKPPLLVQNLRNTTTLRLRDKIPPDFARFFAKRAKTQFEAN
jgi:hypothetical protein